MKIVYVESTWGVPYDYEKTFYDPAVTHIIRKNTDTGAVYHSNRLTEQPQIVNFLNCETYLFELRLCHKWHTVCFEKHPTVYTDQDVPANDTIYTMADLAKQSARSRK